MTTTTFRNSVMTTTTFWEKGNYECRHLISLTFHFIEQRSNVMFSRSLLVIVLSEHHMQNIH